jgi:hypothetical protein
MKRKHAVSEIALAARQHIVKPCHAALKGFVGAPSAKDNRAGLAVPSLSSLSMTSICAHQSSTIAKGCWWAFLNLVMTPETSTSYQDVSETNCDETSSYKLVITTPCCQAGNNALTLSAGQTASRSH